MSLLSSARGNQLWRRAVAVALSGPTLAAAFSLYLGHRLTQPAPAAPGPAPEKLNAETVHFSSTSGGVLSGWLTKRPDAEGMVLLLHGIRSDKRSMVERAIFLQRLGYGTLCLDLQAHGESTGDKITMGYRESKDAASAVAYLRSRFPTLPIVIVGTSLGGASALLANYDIAPDAFIIEAVFSDIETAIKNRLEMRLGPVGALASPLLSMQIRPRIGVSSGELNPLRAIPRLPRPILFIYGASDLHAKPEEGRLLFSAAHEPKELWEIEGAAHVDFYRFATAAYEQRAGAFLSRHVKGPGRGEPNEDGSFKN